MNPHCTNCEPDDSGTRALENREHIQLHCTQIARERQKLKTSLQAFTPHCILTVPLILGNCPLQATHFFCLVFCVNLSSFTSLVKVLAQPSQLRLAHSINCHSILNTANYPLPMLLTLNVIPMCTRSEFRIIA
jgi:hypothetical protein